MPQDLQLVKGAESAMKGKYGTAELYGSNNQYRLDLPNGKRAVIKTGNKGQVMQRTDDSEIDSRFTGLGDADLVVVAVRNKPNDPIRIFEIPVDVYRDRMTSAYAELLESNRLRPHKTRLLRFDGKGYPKQRVDEEWAKYMIKDGSVSPEGSSLPSERSVPQDVTQAIEAAKAVVAEAFGVPVDKVSISVNL